MDLSFWGPEADCYDLNMKYCPQAHGLANWLLAVGPLGNCLDPKGSELISGFIP